MINTPLTQKRCRACEGGVSPLTDAEIATYRTQLHTAWQITDKTLTRIFRFRNYYEVMAFINAVAWLAHTEDHHPDITFGYQTCTILLTTHAIAGLSENDFILAAKIDSLIPT